MTEMPKDGVTMKVFPVKEFQGLFKIVDNLNPLDEGSELESFLIDYITYALDTLGTVKNNGTGRTHLLKSTEASEFFGEQCAQLVYRLIQRMSQEMPSNSYVYDFSTFL